VRLNTATLQLSTLLNHAAKVLKGVLVAALEVLQGFGQRELQVHFAAVSQHHQEEGRKTAAVG
jgi:hypothetical protein